MTQGKLSNPSIWFPHHIEAKLFQLLAKVDSHIGEGQKAGVGGTLSWLPAQTLGDVPGLISYTTRSISHLSMQKRVP